jgi:hypothetical protein
MTTSFCACGHEDGTNTDCERCRLLAEIRRLLVYERAVEHLRELFPKLLHITDQETLARLCRQAPDVVCFCGCHISDVDSSKDGELR